MAPTRGTGTVPIELTVDGPGALFHALDPSPLVGRDLADEVEDFIVETAREQPRPASELIVHLSHRFESGTAEQATANAIRSYFAGRRNHCARKLRSLMRDGRRSLAIGLAFLFICGIMAALAVRTLPGPVGAFVEQGLLIIGWVANWRPVEIFLYDWRPLRRERDLFDALSRMTIRFRTTR